MNAKTISLVSDLIDKLARPASIANGMTLGPAFKPYLRMLEHLEIVGSSEAREIEALISEKLKESDQNLTESLPFFERSDCKENIEIMKN